MHRTPLRILCLALLTVMLVSACGQKPGVLPDLQEKLASGEFTVDAQGNIVDSEGNVVGDAQDLAAAGLGGDGSGGTSPTDSGPGTTGPGTGPGTSPTDPNAPNGEGDPNDPNDPNN